MHSVTWHPNGQPEARTSWYFPDGLVRLTLDAERDLASTALVLLGRVGLRLGAAGPEPLRPGQPHAGQRGALLWRPLGHDAPSPAVAQPLPHESTAPQEPSRRPQPRGQPARRQGEGPRTFVVELDGREVVVPATGVLLIGRHPHCHLRIPDSSVSSFHCALACDGEGVRVVDLRSRNGTWVDSTKVHAAFITRPTSLRVAHRHLSLRPRDEPPTRLVRLPSPAMASVYRLARRIAPTGAPVVIHGETGTGKEGLAHAIHRWSGRKGPFVAINAAVLSSNLAASELFGHVRGAFTGADQARPGAFASADGGTLFLDEIAELRLDVQAELLRVLETKEVRPVGGTRDVPVDVRIVTATHCDLLQRVAEGRFREDLFHRIYVLHLDLPPLRTRPEDIDAIVDAVLAQKSPPRRIDDRARALLHAHPWRGNIRELINVIERACLLTDRPEIRPEDLSLRSAPGPAQRIGTLKRAQALAAYRRHGGNAAAAARELGIHRATLFRYLRQAREAGELGVYE